MDKDLLFSILGPALSSICDHNHACWQIDPGPDAHLLEKADPASKPVEKRDKSRDGQVEHPLLLAAVPLD